MAGGGLPDAKASGVAFDPAAEYISQAYVVPSSNGLEALVFGTSAGKSAGGASVAQLVNRAAVLPAFPCSAGQAYRLAYIKGRAGATGLQQLVLVWEPVGSSGPASDSQRLLLEERGVEPGAAFILSSATGQQAGAFARAGAAGSLPGAGAGRLLLQQQQQPLGAVPFHVDTAEAAAVWQGLGGSPGATSKKLLHSAPHHHSNTSILGPSTSPGSGDSDGPGAILSAHTAKPAPRSRLASIATTTSARCSSRPAAGYLPSGPFTSDGNMQPITSYFNHWLQLGQLVPPAQQPLAKLPAITSVSVFADTPERIAGIRVVYSGGYTMMHGKASTQIQSSLQLGPKESIVQAMVGRRCFGLGPRGCQPAARSQTCLSGSPLPLGLSACLLICCCCRCSPAAAPSGTCRSQAAAAGPRRRAGWQGAAGRRWQGPATLLSPTGWDTWRAGPPGIR